MLESKSHGRSAIPRQTALLALAAALI